MTPSADWVPIAPAQRVGTAPLPVRVAGVPVVLVRLFETGPVVAYLDRCPHRLVPLAAGVVEGGTLRCAYHGWSFDADGRCTDLPSGGSIPPRADLPARPAVREEAGHIWLRTAEVVAAEAAAGSPPPAELLSNVDKALWYAWHPVALSTQLGDQPYRTSLLGREWTVWRRDGGLAAQPSAHALTERWGLVWLAPRPPLVDLFDEPDTEDSAYVGAWLPPATTPAPAGFVADNFLDVAHFPFVHAGTFGAGEARLVPPYEVSIDADGRGCRSVQEQWFDNPEDPGVAAGVRQVRQRRRATYVYRAPFQLMLRLEELDAGAVKTILFFIQPESLRRTRIYTKMLLFGIGGAAVPDAATVAREVAFEEAVLGEDLALQRHIRLTGLPLRMRDELHVRADRLGVTLRRLLRAYVASACGHSGPPRDLDEKTLL